MRKLTDSEYQLLKYNYSSQLELAKHKIVGRGVQALIPMYEQVAGVKMNINCSDCYLDMMTILLLKYNEYEASIPTVKVKRKRNNK